MMQRSCKSSARHHLVHFTSRRAVCSLLAVAGAALFFIRCRLDAQKFAYRAEYSGGEKTAAEPIDDPEYIGWSSDSVYVLYRLGVDDSDTNITVSEVSGRRRTCTFTGNSSLYNVSVAAVFHDDTPLARLPAYRPSHQKWVMRTMETPVNTVLSVVKRIRLKQSRHLFNVTSTYSSRSDVPTPYFDSVCSVADDDDNNNNSSSSSRDTVATGDGVDFARLVSGKDRPVAWFVTHCWTSSRRESYVTELQRYIDVDVYGRCGKFQCAIDRSEECIKLLERRYFFYLAFENSLCVDYITEKFWRLIDRDVIAVTLGAGNYTAVVPPGTHLDVRDFRSPRHLAERMRQLMADGGRLYAEMLRRKRRVRCRTPLTVDGGGRGGFAERLCRYLVETRDRQQTRNLDEVWNANTMCVDAKKFYRGVADSIVKGKL